LRIANCQLRIANTACIGLAAAALVFTAGAMTGCSSKDDSIIPTLREHLKRYPDMESEDIYKLVHQAAMGNGHLFTDTAGAKLYLLNELDEVRADTTEPLIEPLSPDGQIVRMNLRPFKARGGEADQLFDAMVRSANAFQQDPAKLARWWTEIMDEAEYGTIPTDRTTLQQLFDSMKMAGLPARHHSEAYEVAYQPAYRVLLRHEAQQLKLRVRN
jgi:hypothetical protein